MTSLVPNSPLLPGTNKPLQKSYGRTAFVTRFASLLNTFHTILDYTYPQTAPKPAAKDRLKKQRKEV